MDFQSQLAQYREQFARKEAEKSQTAEQPQEKIMWEDELPMMNPMAPQVDPEMMATELEDVEVLRDRDTRFSGDATADEQAYREYLENDPDFQQHSPAMEQILMEVIERAKDPNDPLTAEEAQELFAQRMEEEFSQYFQ